MWIKCVLKLHILLAFCAVTVIYFQKVSSCFCLFIIYVAPELLYSRLGDSYKHKSRESASFEEKGFKDNLQLTEGSPNSSTFSCFQRTATRNTL